MGDRRIYAVLTGDIVGSSRVSSETRKVIMSELKTALGLVRHEWQGVMCGPFEIHRGDSFQGALREPAKALRISVWIRAWLRHLGLDSQPRRGRSLGADARISIGIGEADEFITVSEGQGEAFWYSGRALEAMKGEERLLVGTPWEDIDRTLETETALLDALVHRWSRRQAEVVRGLVRGGKQSAVASELGVSQSAVAQNARQAGWWAIEKMILEFEGVIQERLDREHVRQQGKGAADAQHD